jgi:hypothetical protein
MLALKNLPLSFFTPVQSTCGEESESPVCAICLEAFNDGDELRNLNCCHCFHRACVDIWLLGTLSDDIQLNGTCPTCRRHTSQSPGKGKATQGLTVATHFRHSVDENMSDLSVSSSSVTTSSVARSLLDFDLVSPMSPDWSHDEIFHPEEEENARIIGQYLVDGSVCSRSAAAALDDAEDALSLESMEYSCCGITINMNDTVSDNRMSHLDDILEDEPSIVNEASRAQIFPILLEVSIDDDCDEVISLFSFSDCGFPLNSPQSSTRSKGGE